MSDVAISVENLSKLYRIGEAERRHESLVEMIGATLTAPARNFRRLRGLDTRRDAEADREAEDLLWALRDVSFEVKRGEVLGIIGRNGAGKSTLLKVLSRITEPTRGRVRMRGRVSALLEVGTGFHPELTGRENVYLNGTIMGMTKREIDRKFDEIVEFSGVAKFLDTPVKRYSSGMKVRLAFAVAAHLEPEILIVDEVLAVGDASFQKKCLGKMRDVATGQGRTVLFVSHNMAAVQELCTRAIFLENGQYRLDDKPRVVVGHYLSMIKPLSNLDLSERTDRESNGRLKFTKVRIIVDGEEVNLIHHGDDVTFELSFEAQAGAVPRSLRFGISLLNSTGVKFLGIDSGATDFGTSELPSQGTLRCHIPRFPVISGTYRALLFAGVKGEVFDKVEDAFEIEVTGKSYPKVGFFSIDHQWSLSGTQQEQEIVG